MLYSDYCVAFVKQESEGLDAMYEDYIIHLVGVAGLQSLLAHKLLESCGVVNGRKLYTLCEKKVLKK